MHVERQVICSVWSRNGISNHLILKQNIYTLGTSGKTPNSWNARSRTAGHLQPGGEVSVDTPPAVSQMQPALSVQIWQAQQNLHLLTANSLDFLRRCTERDCSGECMWRCYNYTASVNVTVQNSCYAVPLCASIIYCAALYILSLIILLFSHIFEDYWECTCAHIHTHTSVSFCHFSLFACLCTGKPEQWKTLDWLLGWAWHPAGCNRGENKDCTASWAEMYPSPTSNVSTLIVLLILPRCDIQHHTFAGSNKTVLHLVASNVQAYRNCFAFGLSSAHVAQFCTAYAWLAPLSKV